MQIAGTNNLLSKVHPDGLDMSVESLLNVQNFSRNSRTKL